ncbi:putative protein phosphatase 2C 39 [Vitis vinifera]|uniref:Uncharacterized protein n=1 Tax=Vitis vinifera TaxID=29760 RepID=A0A438GH37_VITVI|nr:putative protein phosphatase 2C 39 [Vitis vinifera]
MEKKKVVTCLERKRSSTQARGWRGALSEVAGMARRPKTGKKWRCRAREDCRRARRPRRRRTSLERCRKWPESGHAPSRAGDQPPAFGICGRFPEKRSPENVAGKGKIVYYTYIIFNKLILKAADNAGSLPNSDYCLHVGFSTEELMMIPAGRRRKYHDDVTVIVIMLGNKQWTSTASTSL